MNPFDELRDLHVTIGDTVRKSLEGLTGELEALKGIAVMKTVSGDVSVHTFKVEPQAELVVNTLGGQVIVSGRGPDGVITVHSTGYDEDGTLDGPAGLQQDGNRVTVSNDGREGSTFSSQVDYRIVVPNGTVLRIGTTDGDVHTSATAGPVDVTTMSGDVMVHGFGAQCTVQTTEGDVRIEGGDGVCRVTSVAGDIVANGVSGEIRAESTNGDVAVRDARAHTAVLTNVNGDCTLDTTFESEGEYAVRSTHGDVLAVIPPDSRVTVYARTTHGDVRCSVPAEVVDADKHHWEGRIAGGGVELTLESVNADVRIRARSRRDQMSSPESIFAGIPPLPPMPAMPPMPPMPSMSPIPPMPPMPPLHGGAFGTESDGGEAEEDEAVAPPADGTIAILARLERGEIEVEEAMRLLDEQRSA